MLTTNLTLFLILGQKMWSKIQFESKSFWRIKYVFNMLLFCIKSDIRNVK
jgi:hypothetical protein